MLKRPPGYQGPLYKEVTKLQWEWLEALASLKAKGWVDYKEWRQALKQLFDLEKFQPPGTMTHGVFEARGWIRIRKDRDGRNRYQIMPKGLSALAAREAARESYEEARQSEEPSPEPTSAEPYLKETLLKDEIELALGQWAEVTQGLSLPEEKEFNVRRYERNSRLARMLKKLYDGKCQICGFTFESKSGENFAEVHHLEALSEGGMDVPANLIVVCANCHRMFHHAAEIERVGWEGNELIVNINGEERRITYNQAHLQTLRK